jgi:hypothetical protein
MIELYLTQTKDGGWELNATVFPQGGVGGIAKESTIASVHEGTFKAALAATSELDLSTLSFTPNPERWPVPEPKFQIVNDGSHSDREMFGNYQVRCGDVVIERIENFPRGNRGELIKKALRIVADINDR